MLATQLMRLVAALALDSGAYEKGLGDAEARFSGFAETLRAGLAAVKGLVTAGAVEVNRDSASMVEDAGRGLMAVTSMAGAALEGVNSASAALARFEAAVDGRMARLSASSVNWGMDMIQGFIDGMALREKALRAAVSGVAALIRSYLHFSKPDTGPLKDFDTYAPDMMALFSSGIRDNAHLVESQVEASFDIAPRILEGGVSAAAREVVVPRLSGNERPVNIVFELDGVQQWVYRLNKLEERRVGVKLSAGGGAY